MADCAAELCAHECCLSGEGKWDSGVCCCCHSFDANGCADAMCCAFAVPAAAWKYSTISKDNWHLGDTWCNKKVQCKHICDFWCDASHRDPTCAKKCWGAIFVCPCPCALVLCPCGSLVCQGGTGSLRKELRDELHIRPALPDWIVACCCLPWFPFLQ